MMKNFVLILVITAMLAVPLHAMDFRLFSTGILGGFGRSWRTGEYSQQSNFGLGFTGGAFFAINSSDFLALEINVLYSEKIVSVVYDGSQVDALGNVFITEPKNIFWQYKFLEFPFLVELSAPMLDMRFSVFAGIKPVVSISVATLDEGRNPISESANRDILMGFTGGLQALFWDNYILRVNFDSFANMPAIYYFQKAISFNYVTVMLGFEFN